jgi:hypothetical protein
VAKTIEGYVWADADKVSFYGDPSTDDDEADATVFIGENAKASETERWAALNIDVFESCAAFLDPGSGTVISKHPTREAAETVAVAYLSHLAELANDPLNRLEQLLKSRTSPAPSAPRGAAQPAADPNEAAWTSPLEKGDREKDSSPLKIMTQGRLRRGSLIVSLVLAAAAGAAITPLFPLYSRPGPPNGVGAAADGQTMAPPLRDDSGPVRGVGSPSVKDPARVQIIPSPELPIGPSATASFGSPLPVGAPVPASVSADAESKEGLLRGVASQEPVEPGPKARGETAGAEQPSSPKAEPPETGPRTLPVDAAVAKIDAPSPVALAPKRLLPARAGRLATLPQPGKVASAPADPNQPPNHSLAEARRHRGSKPRSPPPQPAEPAATMPQPGEVASAPAGPNQPPNHSLAEAPPPRQQAEVASAPAGPSQPPTHSPAEARHSSR